jgi:hypothetical protein
LPLCGFGPIPRLPIVIIETAAASAQTYFDFKMAYLLHRPPNPLLTRQKSILISESFVFPLRPVQEDIHADRP